MKKCVLILLSTFAALQCLALTNINTPNVSGTWNAAGSPYIVQVAITVPAGQSLRIEPGVTVKFMPATRLNVVGSLQVKGTQAQPVTMMANDTTGWSNDNVTTGGWSGLHYLQYSGAGIDSSVMDHCIIQDCKFGFNGPVNEVNPFLTYRKISLNYCTFTHNTTGAGFYSGGDVISLNTYAASDTIVMNHCTVSENSSTFGIIRVNNYMGGFTHIHHGHLHHNHRGATLWATWVNLLFEYNEVDHNDMIHDSAPVKISIGTAKVSHNKVHHNTLDQLAAIGCRSGKIEIDNNLICNNHQMDANCGATGGGGGIHLAHNEGGAQFADTYYKVRNNVIANNRSEYGGGGIYVFTAKADIMNNTIVNNSSPALGQAILVLNPASEVYMKNNLFYGQKFPGVDSTMIVQVLSGNKISFDYNYVQAGFSKTLTGTYAQFVGDTSHNVIGNTPLLMAPTANNQFTTDALNSNFDIQANSPCVDAGDSSGVSALPYDYQGNTRITGSKIDIGAFESHNNAEGVWDTGEMLFRVYPNPARNSVVVETFADAASVLVFNMQGQAVLRTTLSETRTTLDISKLPKGIYILHYRDVTGSSSGKLLIE